MHLHRTKIRKAAIWLCEASSTFLFIRKHSASIKTQGLPVLSKCVYLFNINAWYIIRLLKSPAVHIKKAQLHFFSARLFTVSTALPTSLTQPSCQPCSPLPEKGCTPTARSPAQLISPCSAPLITPTWFSFIFTTAGGSTLTCKRP